MHESGFEALSQYLHDSRTQGRDIRFLVRISLSIPFPDLALTYFGIDCGKDEFEPRQALPKACLQVGGYRWANRKDNNGRETTKVAWIKPSEIFVEYVVLEIGLKPLYKC